VLRISLKGIFARKWRLLLTALAIIFGVAFISGTAVLSDILGRSVNELVDDAYRGIDAVVRSANAQESPFSNQPLRDPIPQTTLDLIREARGVSAAEGVVQVQATLLDKDGKPLSAFGPPTIALNWLEDRRLASGTLSEGRRPEGPGELVLDFRTAEDLGFRLGDRVTVQLPAGPFTGTLVGLGGLGSEGDKSTGSKIILIETAELQRLAGIPGAFSYLAVAADRGVSQEELADTLGSILPPDQEVITGKEFIAENQQQVAELVNTVTTLIQAFGYIAAFVGAFVIYNTFSILVAQRIREMALLRAVGASRRQILGSVLLEAFATGLIAAVVGLFAGFGLAILLKVALGSIFTLSEGLPRLTTGAVVQSLLIGVLVTMIASIIPALRATRVAPVAAMTESAAEVGGLSTKRKLFGAIAAVAGVALIALAVEGVLSNVLGGIGLGAALLFVALAALGPLFAGQVVSTLARPFETIFGVTGRIARQNAARNPKRTTATAVALTIGVGIVCVIAVIAASFKATFEDAFSSQLRADLVIDSGGFGGGGFSREVREQVAEVDGVETVASLRFNIGRVLNSKKARELAQRPEAVQQADPQGDGRTGLTGPAGEGDQTIIGIDPQTYVKLADLGRITPSPDALVDNTVMVAESLMERNNWKIGDVVEMWFSTGGTQRWPIVATYEKGFGPGSYLVTNPTFDSVTPPPLRADLNLYVKVADNAEVASVQKRIEKTIAKTAPAARVQDIGSYVKEITKTLDGLLNFIYLLLALAIFVALLGIINTLVLSILERRRELGLLRAVGMERRQVRRAIRWEAASIALFGTAMGLVLGVALAAFFVQGFRDPEISLAIPWPTVIVIAVGGALCGVLSAIWPAHRAARVDVLDALATT
jgi:putative ABC transport system permease protein